MQQHFGARYRKNPAGQHRLALLASLALAFMAMIWNAPYWSEVKR